MHMSIVLGWWLEAQACGRASEAIKCPLGLQPKTARVRRDGNDVDMPVVGVQTLRASSRAARHETSIGGINPRRFAPLNTRLSGTILPWQRSSIPFAGMLI
jgi:hypothetical protein